jgi:hypothetical protein
MIFKAQEVVRGISNMSWNIDGQVAQVKCAHVDVKLDSEQGGKGCRTDAMPVLNPGILDAIKHNNFPMLAELEIEQLATKGKTRLVIVGITPLQVAKPNQAQVDTRKAVPA